MNHVKKPDWLKINIGANARYTETKHIVDSHKLHTICSSGRCPNMGECWGKGTATFMIGGEICTRSCKFCNTQTGRPLPLDPEEPTHVAESIQLIFLDMEKFNYSVSVISAIESMIIIVSILMMLYKKDGRGLHDIIAKTNVIREE